MIQQHGDVVTRLRFITNPHSSVTTSRQGEGKTRSLLKTFYRDPVRHEMGVRCSINNDLGLNLEFNALFDTGVHAKFDRQNQ